MVAEPDSLIVQILRDMRAQIADVHSDLSLVRNQGATNNDIESWRSDLRSDMHSLRTDMAADLLAQRRKFSEQIVGLRRAVIEYYTTVIGHDVLHQRA